MAMSSAIANNSETSRMETAFQDVKNVEPTNYAWDLDYKLTAESRRRVVPSLKRLYEIVGKPGLISLAGGMPNSSIFPFDRVGGNTLRPPFSKGVGQSKLSSSEAMKFKVFQNYDEAPGDATGDIELSTALQYGEATGDARLRKFIKDHVDYLHSPSYADRDVIMTVGNTCAWDTVLRTFCEPSDVLLFEDFTFPTALENAQTRGCDCYGVEMDEHGIVIEDLRNKARKYRPKLLYLIPTGQNPTGTVLPNERRKGVVKVAEEFDFLIVEDEPYYYLTFDDGKTKEKTAPTHVCREPMSAESHHYSTNLVNSLLDYDSQGRVIRLDSFSKIMAPGIRLGWITCQQRFCDALRKTMETSCSKPSGFAQTLVYAVLRRWGQAGLFDWLRGLQKEYTQRRDICCKTLIDELAWDSVHVSLPEAGMFFWLTITMPNHKPSEAGKLEELFFESALENEKVVVVPGRWCKVDKAEFGEEQCTLHFRGTFASETRDNLVEGAQRLACAVNAFVGMHEHSNSSIGALAIDTNEPSECESFTHIN